MSPVGSLCTCDLKFTVTVANVDDLHARDAFHFAGAALNSPRHCLYTYIISMNSYTDSEKDLVEVTALIILNKMMFW